MKNEQIIQLFSDTKYFNRRNYEKGCRWTHTNGKKDTQTDSLYTFCGWKTVTLRLLNCVKMIRKREKKKK